MKALSLVFFQLVLCLAASLLLGSRIDSGNEPALTQIVRSPLLFWNLVIASLLCILIQYECQSRYPANYVLLALSTLLLTLLWSLGGESGMLFSPSTEFHTLLLGIMVVAVMVAVPLMHALSFTSLEAEPAVCSAILIGWLVGAVAILSSHWFYEIGLDSALVAAGITFLLFVALLVDIGGRLAVGDPDSWMRVVIAMDASLLMTVSMPFLVIIAGIGRAMKGESDRERAARTRRRGNDELDGISAA